MKRFYIVDFGPSKSGQELRHARRGYALNDRRYPDDACVGEGVIVDNVHFIRYNVADI